MIQNRITPDFVDENIFNLRNTRVHKFKLPIDIFATLTGVRKGWIKRYETGRNLPGRTHYNRLAKFFGWQKWEA